MPSSLDASEGRDLATTQPISVSPVRSRQSSPPVPFAVNLSESASMPFSAGSMQSHPQVAPSDRVRIKRSVHRRSASSQDPTNKVGQVWLPHDLTQNSQIFNGAGIFRSSGDVIRPVQPRERNRGGPTKRKGESLQWDSANRDNFMATSSTSWRTGWNNWNCDPQQ